MNWQGQNILIVGLGLTGWSAVRYLHSQGACLRVCDSRATAPFAAQLQDEFPQVPLFLGPLNVANLEGLDALVVSPGLDLNQPFFQRARELGLPVLGDIEVFARDNRVPVLAVTGSNGKSTVVTLLGEMAKAAGRHVLVGGNIGTPALDLLSQPADLIVLELSSFQLELTESLSCVAACVLNLSADHIDRHGDLAAYAQAKARIYAGAQLAVVNADDSMTADLVPAGLPQRQFALTGADFHIRDGVLYAGENPLLAASELKLLGIHNQLNVLAALALGQAAGLSMPAMLQAAKDFAGLAHRCEWVAERKGVRWVNDSKGTNVGATLAALQGLPAKVVLLAGGQAKGGDFSPWCEPLAEKGRAVLLFGEDAEGIAQDLQPLSGLVPVELLGDLATAVSRADDVAEAGDSVLLSPGCASFDQFSGFVERGERFCALVEALA